MTEKDFYNIEIGDKEILVNNSAAYKAIIRVPGGWLYEIDLDDNLSVTFIPYVEPTWKVVDIKKYHGESGISNSHQVYKLPKNFLHNHPDSEKKMDLNVHHVIVDKLDWLKAKELLNIG